jgi:arrestin-related trafficking adapter 4/5/7
VISVTMSIQEKVKALWRSLHYENPRIISSTERLIRRDRLVRIRTPSEMEPASEPPLASPPSFFDRATARSRENLRSMFRIRESSSRTTSGGSAPASVQSPPDSDSDSSSTPSRNSGEHETVEGEDEDVEIVVRLFIPPTATPSHGISPIMVSHRIKWDVLIANLDGHRSELRCSLPVQLLDHAVLEEAQAATRVTRSLLFGPDYEPDQPHEIILPSYPDHVRDRVADAALHAALLASNPLATDAHLPEDDVPATNILSSSHGPDSTFSTTQSRFSISRVTSLPVASERGRLEGPYNSELYHSLGRDSFNSSLISTPPDSQNASRQSSRNSSRNSSRAPSPDLMIPGEYLEPPSRPATPHRPRTPGKFSLKPFTPFSKRSKSTTTIDFSRSSTSSMSLSLTPSRTTPNSEHSDPFHHPCRSSTAPSTVGLSHCNVYDTVPDYTIAASGFLGGGITPLSGLRGLPSYYDAERVQGTTASMDTT